MNIRGEIRNFLFYVREAWTDFLKIQFVLGQQYLAGPLSGQISSNEFTEGMRFNLLQ